MKYPTAKSPPRHLLCEIVLDLLALDRAGRLGEAYERCRLALREYQEHARGRTIGAGVTVDLLALDVARLVGCEIGIVRSAAREALIDSPAGAVARELRQMRQERRGNR